MYKKFLAGISVLTVVLVSACTAKPIAINKEYSLTYWGVFEPKENIQPFIDEYQKAHPNIKITYIRKGLKEYKQQIQARAGKENGPDIFRYHNSWVPELRPYLAITPQTVVDDLKYQQTFYQVAQNDLQYNRGYLGIPLMYDGLGLYYNKGLFQSAGLDKPPEHWGDVLATAQQLKSPKGGGNIEIAGIAMGSIQNVDYWQDIFALLMLQSQASLKTPASTGENTQTAISFYYQAQRDGLWSDALPNSVESFAQGKLAMMFGTSWTAFEIQQKNSSIDFGVVPVPQLPGSKIGIASYWVEGVAAAADPNKQTESWKFLNFLAQKETQQQLYTKQATSRLFGEPYSRTDVAPQLMNNSYIGAILDNAPQAQSIYFSDKTFGGGLSEELSKAYGDMMTGKENMTNSDKYIQATYTKYGVPLQ
jgi:multiple sugar transport system substrate-binding protein